MERNTNIEILRIAAIVFVVIGHLCKWHNQQFGCAEIETYPITNSGVDIFIIITGYWGIKPSLNKVVSLLVTMFYYGIVSVLILYLLGSLSFLDLLVNLLKAFWIFSGWWFMLSYLALFLFSPLLDYLLQQIEKIRNFYIVVFAFIDFVVQTNTDGFYGLSVFGGALLHFIVLYLIGRELNLRNIRCKYSSLVFVIVTIILFVLNTKGFESYFLIAGKDTSPLVVVQSVSLLMMAFSGPQIHVAWINKIASFAFPVYLLHASAGGVLAIKTLLVSKIITDSCICDIFLCAIIIYLVSLPIDMIRIWLCSPIQCYLISHVNKDIFKQFKK